MPNLTPRKDEVRRVLAVLEDPGFESGEDMAKAVIKETYQILLEREWYALAWKPGAEPEPWDVPDVEDLPEGVTLSLGAPALCWGPFTSESEAERFAKKLAVGGIARSVRLGSVGMMEAHVARTAKGKAKNCPNCGHPIGTHLHERQMGKCMVKGCKCKSMALAKEE